MLHIKSQANSITASKAKVNIRYRRMLLPMLLIALLFNFETRTIVTSVLADAFLQVSAFVAATLSLYYVLEKHISALLPKNFIANHNTVELAGASFLGALPGCGGAIVIITQFTKGNVSFGAVVAVLTSTMGDAAFLLLAQRPFDGITIMLIGVSVGFISGYIVNKFHNRDFMRPKENIAYKEEVKQGAKVSSFQKSACILSYKFWRVALFPTLIIALLLSFQIDPNSLLGFELGVVETAGAVACFFIVFLWSISSVGSSYKEVTSEDVRLVKQSWMMKAALDTQFVTSWVVAAFLFFELTILWTGFDLSEHLAGLGSLTILLAIGIGLLPGCGPQILVTSLYLQNTIPFSAQIGNAISNDGDALFPAIALAPKAALVATLYSTIPALIFGYSYYFIFE